MSGYDKLLGRRPDTPRDPRDYPMSEALRKLVSLKRAVPLPKMRKSRRWRRGPILDQSKTPPSPIGSGDHPYCTGFALTARVIGSPVCVKLPDPQAFALSAYFGAQDNDEFEGHDYDGSSGRGACAWLVSQGMAAEYHACQTAQGVADTIRRYGPVLLGTEWSDSMFDPDKNAQVHFDPQSIAGGHEYLAYGFNGRTNMFLCQNSWGTDWGRVGTFFLSLDTLTTLMERGGDAFVPTEVSVHKAA